MSIKTHQQNRQWAFQALEILEQFMTDPEFEGDKESEVNKIIAKRRELKDGKYRVVFLGEFNVGKTTLINAFLGDTYLPMVLEECTAKITHVMRGDAMQLILRAKTPIPAEVIQVLREFLTFAGIDASLTMDDSYNHWIVQFTQNYPENLFRTLNAIVTLSADEEFPKLKLLRELVDEVVAIIPETGIEEDVAFVDSPGVHSITETHHKITEDIIPHCHLVVCLLDSQNAGNEHNRDFIARLVQERHRKVFFVINKSDQLNPDEIDPQGRRGPAKDLLRCLDGIVEDPEIFFVSALYALYANQLQRGRLTLYDIDRNEKVHIPYSIRMQVEQLPNPANEIAQYLLQRSAFQSFKDRLFNYLYHENREGAVLHSVCKFIRDLALRMAKPFEVKIQLAQQNPKLDRIRQERLSLQAQIERNTKFLEQLLKNYEILCAGGTLNDERFEGDEQLINRLFSRQIIENEIFTPIRQWLCSGNNLKTARKQKYVPLQIELGRILDNYLRNISTQVNNTLTLIENKIIAQLTDAGYNVSIPHHSPIEVEKGAIVAIEASLALSYFIFFLTGAILGAIAGAIIGEGFLYNFSWADLLQRPVPSTPHLSAYILGGLGAIVGSLLGLFTRSYAGDEIRREKLIEKITEYVEQTLIQGLKTKLKQDLEDRHQQFIQIIQQYFDVVNTSLYDKIRELANEEDRLERAQKELIERLQGKANQLREIAERAQAIIDTTLHTSITR